MAETVRARVHYVGYVQGVGFRYTAVMISRQFAVTGTVVNLPNGQVELVAEGNPPDVDAFLTRMRERMTKHIDTESVAWETATGEFVDFSILY